MAFIDNVKPWFETGDFPTQAQFYQLFEWLRWKDEAIQINEVFGLQQILNQLASPVEAFTPSGDEHVYTIPEGFLLEKIILRTATPSNLSVEFEGTLTPGDIVPEVQTSGNSVLTVNVFATSPKNIKVTGIPAGANIYYIKRKIY